MCRWWNTYTYCHSDSHGYVHSDSHGYVDSDSNGNCYSNGDCDRTTAGYTNATASPDTAAATLVS